MPILLFKNNECKQENHTFYQSRSQKISQTNGSALTKEPTDDTYSQLRTLLDILWALDDNSYQILFALCFQEHCRDISKTIQEIPTPSDLQQ